MVLGDFNGDGRTDLAVGTYNGVAVLLNAGEGQYGPAAIYAHGIFVSSIAVGDFNRDGKLDLVIPGANAVNILFGNGDGTFQSPASVPLPYNTSAFAVGDFNGDGKTDLAVTMCTGLNTCILGVLFGNGNGTFQQVRTTGFTSSSRQSLILGDFNHDGKLDAAVTSYFDNEVWIFLGNGNGTFQLTTSVATPSSPSAAAVGDLNKDGKLDLVVAMTLSGLWVLLGNGNGTFQSPVFYPAFNGAGLAIGDLNNDSNPDLVMVTGNSDRASVLIGNGNGTFQPPQLVQIAIQNSSLPGAVAVADVNADGKEDVLIANDNSDTVSLLLGNGDGTFQNERTTSPLALQFVTSYAVGDFNNDGKLDLLVGGDNFQTYLGMSILLGNGDGTFGPRTDFGPNPIDSIATGDFNGDGNLDIVATSFVLKQIYVLLGKGDGTFQAPVALNFDQISLSVLIVCDVNQDGKMDLIAVTPLASASPMSLFLGNGNGTFQPPLTSSLEGVGAKGLVCKDLNGDKIPDLVYTHQTLTVSDVLVVALGRGDGTFTSLQDISLTNNLYTSVGVVADLNADGRPDLVINGTGGTTIYLGQGDGTFQPGASGLNGHGLCNSVADFNHDGKLDLACGGVGDYIAFLLGHGDGTFEPAGIAFGLANSSNAITGDFNGDGKPDLITDGSILLNVTPIPGPSADSVTPSSGAGSAQAFTFAYSDTKGASDIQKVFAIFNSTLTTNKGCALVYSNSTNALYLMDDTGAKLLPVALGSGTVSNSQCLVNGAATSVSATGNNLALTISLSFKPSFYGQKNVYIRAVSNEGLDSEYQSRGTWTGAVNAAPSAVSVIPGSGSGVTQLFKFIFQDPNGFADIQTAFLLLNSSLTAAHGCFVAYLRTSNQLVLLNDMGTAPVAGSITPGGAGTLSNSQCTLGSGGPIVGSGNLLGIPVILTFSGALAGQQNVYGLASDLGGLTSSWSIVGSWTP